MRGEAGEELDTPAARIMARRASRATMPDEVEGCVGSRARAPGEPCADPGLLGSRVTEGVPGDPCAFSGIGGVTRTKFYSGEP